MEFVQVETGEGGQAHMNMHAAVIMTGEPALSKLSQAVFNSLPTFIRGVGVGLRVENYLEAVTYRTILFANGGDQFLDSPRGVVVVVDSITGVLDFQLDAQEKRIHFVTSSVKA